LLVDSVESMMMHGLANRKYSLRVLILKRGFTRLPYRNCALYENVNLNISYVFV